MDKHVSHIEEFLKNQNMSIKSMLDENNNLCEYLRVLETSGKMIFGEPKPNHKSKSPARFDLENRASYAYSNSGESDDNLFNEDANNRPSLFGSIAADGDIASSF